MSADLRENLFADEQQRVEAGQLLERVEESLAHAKAQVTLPDDVHLSQDFTRFLAKVLQQIAAGGSVSVSSWPEEVSTSVAASLLGVSRPTLMKHVRAGRLDAHKVGSHTRLKTEDVRAFRHELIKERRAALNELLELEDELGL
ncbi:helix-turn-helix domain-containing protein [Isoptericola sp. b408]|uniref:helix-turn-helix domain-containing protein n=1 Tax=Isoptericola sp. b408 TaxID=3064653 RepID=UPI002713A358|nr:helix-turn-helix domain-containing protein [Isoptericola sp. b408]MDO8150108.1 helix-turn-helix domain-containing protein [Isoptericola sp. b408]